MSNFITLRLESEPPPRDSMFNAQKAREENAGSQLRCAFLALLAANVFVISAALCFAFLYFFRQ